jgi:multiple sugar transport system permease protein
VLVAGAIYCVIPIVWVLIAATKAGDELFTLATFQPGTGLWGNLVDLFAYSGGIFGAWAANSLLYSCGGALASTLVSALAGYALAKYDFRGKNLIFAVLLAGVLIPGITLAIPQYFVMSSLGLTNTHLSVLLPVLISPFGIYLVRIYASASVPDETVEAARIDGAGEFRIFALIGVPMMLPGLVTVFLLQFIWVWNNFLLPYLMLSDDSRFPLTLGFYTMMNRGATEPALYSAVITGSAISILAIIALMGSLQRFWKLDLLSGGLKG